MKRKITYFLAFFLFMYSCTQNDLVELDGVEKIYLKNCVEFTQDEFVIDSRDELTEVFKDVISTTYCADFVMPDIDFEAETLIGLKTASPIRNRQSVKREVVLDPNEDKYIYIVYQSEQLKEVETQVNWVIVPILPDGYTVEFSIR